MREREGFTTQGTSEGAPEGTTKQGGTGIDGGYHSEGILSPLDRVDVVTKKNRKKEKGRRRRRTGSLDPAPISRLPSSSSSSSSSFDPTICIFSWAVCMCVCLYVCSHICARTEHHPDIHTYTKCVLYRYI